MKLHIQTEFKIDYFDQNKAINLSNPKEDTMSHDAHLRGTESVWKCNVLFQL